MHANEIAFIVAGECDARSAVSFVADDQVEFRQAEFGSKTPPSCGRDRANWLWRRVLRRALWQVFQGHECLYLPKADVGRCRIADALMVSQVFVVGDEGLDLSFEIARQVKFSSRIRLSSHFARSTYHASGAGYS
jgi:hypothetical protein